MPLPHLCLTRPFRIVGGGTRGSCCRCQNHQPCIIRSTLRRFPASSPSYVAAAPLIDALVAQLISSISDKEKSVRGSCVESLVALGQQHPPHVISALCIYLQQASSMIIVVAPITITITPTTTALAHSRPAAMVETPLRSRMSLPQNACRNPYRSPRRSS
jgi:hypothetical protein